jgi:choline-glycine betaine transporter
VLAALFMLLILVVGPTVFILSSFKQNVGFDFHYLRRRRQRHGRTRAPEQPGRLSRQQSPAGARTDR